MWKEKPCFFFRTVASLFLVCLAVVCNQPFPAGGDEPLSFTVLDAGQGLAQILVHGERAMLFDIGPPEAWPEWSETYALLGRPSISAIVLSHREIDHTGGLQFIDGSVQWTGETIVGRGEDTSSLRKKLVNWNGPLRFTQVAAGDSTLFSGSCVVRFIWPPGDGATEPASDTLFNRFSLVALIEHGYSRTLVTGDIDSTAMRLIVRSRPCDCAADIVVVPHHGSAGSACPLFYGYVRPHTAVISCGKMNDYGHPSPEVVDMLFDMGGIDCFLTRDFGTMSWESNGFYWIRRF